MRAETEKKIGLRAETGNLSKARDEGGNRKPE
jgi:hypothetical protein